MSEAFLGEIRIFGGNYAPNGWAFCEGQLLQIAQNDALFSLIGTTYGGDGETTFALPDLRGRLPVHQGSGLGLTARRLGEQGGAETVTLTASQMPAHTHQVQASTRTGTRSQPDGQVLAASPAVDLYLTDPADVALAPAATTSSGGSQPHTNLSPYLCVNFIIALYGIYPSRT